MNLFFILFLLLFISTEYSEFHGTVVSQITNGTSVDEIEAFNFISGMIYLDTSTNMQSVCGASIVSPNKYIVTCAHCVEHRELITLYFGSKNICNPYYALNITQANIIIHPEYSGHPNHLNDIAVIVGIPLPTDPKFGQIELVKRNYVPKKMNKVTLFGYTGGLRPDYSPILTDLNYVSATIADFSACQRSYSTKNVFLVEGLQFCVNLRGKYNQSNVNYGDSGGAVLTKDRHLLGLISQRLDGIPEVMTNIMGYFDFIEHPRAFVMQYYQQHNQQNNQQNNQQAYFNFL
ncbi:serine protease 7-like [Contarinia nasturtii]|uniref:serine protease 7-like n=1 Tax=Contarinia nasturtii TaxID=265458 RepID=UPI0012D49612|nr:serine protease 7-like [Contarinia nasturtii]